MSSSSNYRRSQRQTVSSSQSSSLVPANASNISSVLVPVNIVSDSLPCNNFVLQSSQCCRNGQQQVTDHTGPSTMGHRSARGRTIAVWYCCWQPQSPAHHGGPYICDTTDACQECGHPRCNSCVRRQEAVAEHCY
ncbi:Protein of unknown function [Pyronema omphalodes CBS 100304]|uniref:Uncharacterized protein n=1 Tax=Pyronema omphalodes (strain CBS 100304) TaxID=1076935 RepID=U4KYS6_PYROM|nr:Protein of unknown function [Pyronema omphalodes CBS 100304]